MCSIWNCLCCIKKNCLIKWIPFLILYYIGNVLHYHDMVMASELHFHDVHCVQVFNTREFPLQVTVYYVHKFNTGKCLSWYQVFCTCVHLIKGNSIYWTIYKCKIQSEHIEHQHVNYKFNIRDIFWYDVRE